ncbi:MAG: sugar ABC transporter permease [Methanomassiliicoccales archaeon]|nr:sugar ABC transporter permease [Methanomassiliicoccales archaeon]
MIYSLTVSFRLYDLRMPRHPFVGFKNYIHLFTDPRFHNALKVTGLLLLGELGLQFPIGFGLAILLTRKFRGKKMVQPLLLIPMMITPVVVGYMGRLLFETRSGPINYFLNAMGLPSALWHTSASTALLTVVLIDTWQWTPFMMGVLLAGLVSLPTEPYESAKVDGASGLQIFWYLTLPLLKPVIALVIVMRALAILQSFDIIYVLTMGGPGTATETIGIYTYLMGFRYWDIGRASSAAWVLAMLLSVGVTIFLKIIGRERR